MPWGSIILDMSGSAVARRRAGALGTTERHGFSLAEMLVVLLVIAILLALGIPHLSGAADRAATRAAARELGSLLAGARQRAIHLRAPVVVSLDTAAGIVRIWTDTTVFTNRSLSAAYGVVLSATRDSLAYDARGLGIGAANLSVAVRRGRAAETVFVSRLGRVRQ
jgi:prepilin-type N-terminal cleavage/methylation domain-containing protein